MKRTRMGNNRGQSVIEFALMIVVLLVAFLAARETISTAIGKMFTSAGAGIESAGTQMEQAVKGSGSNNPTQDPPPDLGGGGG